MSVQSTCLIQYDTTIISPICNRNRLRLSRTMSPEDTLRDYLIFKYNSTG